MKPWKDFCIENNLFTKSAVSVHARYREKKRRETRRGAEEGATNVYRGSPRRFIDVAVAISSASIWTLTRVERRTRNRETPSTRWRRWRRRWALRSFRTRNLLERLRLMYARNGYRYVYVYNIDNANFSWCEKGVCRKERQTLSISEREHNSWEHNLFISYRVSTYNL